MGRIYSSYCEPSKTPTVDSAGVVNGAAGQYSFKYASRPCLVSSNATASPLYISINPTTDPSATSYDFLILGVANGGVPYDISLGGMLAIKTLRIFIPTGGSFSNVLIKGWSIVRDP